MDPTTGAHIDPSTLTTAPSGADNMPGLTVRPTGAQAASGQTTSGQMSSAQTGSTQSPAVQHSSSAQSTSSSTPTATGLRQRVNKIGGQLENASDHPAVKNAKGAAVNQIDQLRGMLGQLGFVRDLEARTGVDRVVLVVGAALA